MSQNNYGDTWKVTTILIAANNLIIEKADSDQVEDITCAAENIDYLKSVLEGTNLESRVITLIY